MPNFKKLAKGYEKDAVLALQKFVRINSVYDESSIGPGKPYGAGVKKALDYFAKLGEDFGFKVRNIDGHAVELEVGEEGSPLIGIYGHSDVVPVSGTWEVPPFSATLKEGKIIGRGALDDKGPLTASLFAVKLLKDNGLIKGYRVKIVSGGDEERGSSCLKYYFEKGHGETPRFGITPDANWPLIYAEKGITHGKLTKTIGLDPIIAMDGGVVANAVCDSLLVSLKPDEKFAKYLKENKIDCDINSSKELLLVRFAGKTAHGSTPELGLSAAKVAFETIGRYYKNEFLSKLATIFDNNGKTFQGYSHSKELGDSTYNFGLIKYGDQKLTLSVDFRYGEEAKPEESLKNLSSYVGMDFISESVAPYLLYDKKSPLVSTLMKAYKRETMRFFDKPLAIGGGTYAKEAPNTVAFGAEWDSRPGGMHSPNEHMIVKDFIQDIAIYARAIYMLGKVK